MGFRSRSSVEDIKKISIDVLWSVCLKLAGFWEDVENATKGMDKQKYWRTDKEKCAITKAHFSV